MAVAFVALAFLCAGASAQGFSFISPSSIASPAPDAVVVMPFENRSQIAKYNWICDSFAILIGDVLDAHGVSVINVDTRNLAFERLRLSPSDLLTRAAMIRVAGAAQANLALVGEFDIGESKESVTISITARLIETREGRLVGAKTFNYSGSLSDLQEWQGQLAWNIVYERNLAPPYSKEQMIRRAKRTPPAAYESFVKGVQTRDLKLRESFLLRALQECENSGGAGYFPQAIYELGLLYYRQADFAEAAKLLKRLSKDDPIYVESLFYLGLAAYKAGDANESSSAFERLIELAPGAEAVNNAGAFLLAKGLAASGQQAEATRADNEAKRYLSNYARWTVAPDRIPMLARFKEELNRATIYKKEGQWRIKIK